MPACQQLWYEKYGFQMIDSRPRGFDMPMPGGYDSKKIHDDIVEAISTYQMYMRPYAFAMEMVREMARQFNEQPIIITARPAKLKDITETWLKEYLGIPYTLVTTGSEQAATKADAITDFRIKYFVDDRFRTVNALNMCEKAYMPDRIWNSGRTPQDFVVRVANLIEVWDDIMKEEELRT
jgi:uncharacterized HAD superfamily protein